jgi:hypothetical protein
MLVITKLGTSLPLSPDLSITLRFHSTSSLLLHLDLCAMDIDDILPQLALVNIQEPAYPQEQRHQPQRPASCESSAWKPRRASYRTSRFLVT